MNAEQAYPYSYCNLPKRPERELAAGVTPVRARMIRATEKKWVNGTNLRFYFFQTPEWGTSEEEKNIIRRAFQEWMNLGIGIKFSEITQPEYAEIRIGFLRGDGAWSYIGRDILNFPTNERTMNFGWDLTADKQGFNTALHEIGHTLGFPHEHQNPYAGIVWNEEKVYNAMGGAPNHWDRDTTYENIIKKISTDSVQGSRWDPDSIMHYPFGPGMILEPAAYQNGLTPVPGLSANDIDWVQKFYPPLSPNDYSVLMPPQDNTPLNLENGEQTNFILQPGEDGSHIIRASPNTDMLLVLFLDRGGELYRIAAADDSGQELQAEIRTDLNKAEKYVLSVHLYYKEEGTQAGLTVLKD